MSVYRSTSLISQSITLAILTLAFLTPSIEELYGYNLYLLSVPVSLLLLLLTFNISFRPEFLVFILLLFSSSITGIFLSDNIPDGFYHTFYLFIIQPVFLYIACYLTNKEHLYIDFIAKLTIVSFLGSIYFYFAIYNLAPSASGLFDPKFTTVGGDTIALRNTSIFKSSLVASGVGLIHACAAAFMFDRTRKKIYAFLFLAALFVIFASLSRRGFLPAFLLCAYTFKNLSSQGKKWTTLLTLLTLLFAINSDLLNILNILLNRIISALDFSGLDTSNISRVTLIKAGITIALFHPLGSGLGTLSSIGKAHDTLFESVGFKTVTESFYVSFIGEVGWLYCIPIFFIIYKSIRGCQENYRKFFIYPFLIESIMGLGLINPLISLFFMVCIFSSIQKKF